MARERSKQEDGWWQEADEFLNFSGLGLDGSTSEQPRQEDDIPFVWKGEDANPCERVVITRAFELAGRLDVAKSFGEDIGDHYYITDKSKGESEKTGRFEESMSLQNKYGIEARLQDGVGYFLCQI